MSYTPKTWTCGDAITAEELNRMESGIEEASQGGGGSTPLIVNASTEDNFEWVCDKTYGEIDDAVRSGVAVVVIYERITEGWEVYTAGTVLGTQDSLNNSVWRGNVSVCGDPYDASLIALFRVQGASRDALRDEYPTYSTGD